MGLRVLVTGASGYLGKRVVARLAHHPEVEHIVALDLRPFPLSLPRVTPVQRSILDPMDELLRQHGVEALVHLAFVLEPRRREWARRVNREGLERVLQGCAEAGVRRVLYFSSATVYGAHPDNSIPLTEESPPRPNRGFPYAEDKWVAEGVLARFGREHPEVCITVLRGCVVLGPSADNFITRALDKPLLVGVLGEDPPQQFLHEEDLAEAVARLVAEPRPGVFNIAGEGTVRYSETARLLGRPLVRLPAPLLSLLIGATWALGLQRDSSPAGLAFIRWPWVVSTERLRRAVGFTPRYTSRQALEAYRGGG